MVELSNEERPVSKKKKLIGGNPTTRTRSATKAGGGGTPTFTLEDNPVDSIVCDLEGVRSRIAEYELQMQRWKKWWATLRGRVWLPRYKMPCRSTPIVGIGM